MMRKAVFLDRDGVLNKEIGAYISTLAEFELNKDVPEALKIISKKGYLLIVITNQGGIAKGLYTHETLNEIHGYMISYLEKYDVHLDALYYCPHHPDFSGK